MSSSSVYAPRLSVSVSPVKAVAPEFTMLTIYVTVSLAEYSSVTAVLAAESTCTISPVVIFEVVVLPL